MGSRPGRPDESSQRASHGQLRRLLRALVSPDSYGSILLLLIVSYAAAVSWSTDLSLAIVVFVEIGTVWLALRTSGARRWLRFTTLVFMAIAASMALVNLFGRPDVAGGVFALATILYVIAPVSIVRHLVSRQVIDQETMLGAICAYILLGFAFAFVYRMLGAIQSPPFFDGQTGQPTIAQTLFFSFTTLTTTGYGNLVPEGNPGQSLAVLEMFMGQLFLIAALGKIVAEWRPRRWQRATEPEQLPDDGSVAD